jgi:hypothetical protein
MKQIKFLALGIIIAGTALFLNSCCKKKGTTTTTNPPPSNQVVTFNIPYSDTGNLPAIPALPIEVSQDSFTSFLVPTYADSLFKANGSTPQKVLSVYAKSIIMTLYKQGQKFDFIKAMKLYAANKNGSGKVLIGRKDVINITDSIINLDLENIDLKNFIAADTFMMILGATNRANYPIPAGTAVNFTTQFEVKANP